MKKILIVDDQEDCILLHVHFIKKYFRDVEYISFTSPKEALQSILSDSYDIVITDYNMPEISGEELAIKVKEVMGDKAPKIVLTSGDPYQVKDKSLFVAVLYKLDMVSGTGKLIAGNLATSLSIPLKVSS